jgi:hypothetical protein
MKKNPSIAAALITGLIACQQPGKPKVVTMADSSRNVTDSIVVPAPPRDSATAPAAAADTIAYRPEQLTGRWLQPVTGLEKEMQGFELRKDGAAKSINMYTLVYEKWRLLKDTLLLWNHTEGVQEKDSAATVDTTIIRALTDSTLVLFPIKAAEGYLEHYTKTTPQKKK